MGNKTEAELVGELLDSALAAFEEVGSMAQSGRDLVDVATLSPDSADKLAKAHMALRGIAKMATLVAKGLALNLSAFGYALPEEVNTLWR